MAKFILSKVEGLGETDYRNGRIGDHPTCLTNPHDIVQCDASLAITENPMPARIYQRPKNAMQSGRANSDEWVLEFMPSEVRTADPLMGWAGSGDTQVQVQLKFADIAAARAYASKNGIKADIVETPPRSLKLQAYADNFR
jgi:ETC complex I subunit conserved region